MEKTNLSVDLVFVTPKNTISYLISQDRQYCKTEFLLSSRAAQNESFKLKYIDNSILKTLK